MPLLGDADMVYHNGVQVDAIYAGSRLVWLNAVDHGDLTGLADDDHTQYVHTSGSGTMTGALTLNNGGSQPLHAAAKRHFDDLKADIADAPTVYVQAAAPSGTKGDVWVPT